MGRQAGTQTVECSTKQGLINNSFYEELEDMWYTATDHPIALLRAENTVRVPWIIKNISKPGSDVLDIGCGAGFLTNPLALVGHKVSGVDLSEKSLKIAQKHDATKQVTYQVANAYSLPFANDSFDVVCAMDILEHVDEPALLLAEASRVLRTGGQFFFHTFNRNFLSYILIIKGVEWCVKNTPKNMHVYHLFIKPEELEEICSAYDLKIETLVGFKPKLFTPSFLKMLFTRKIPPKFSFCFAKSVATGYCGIAKKTKKEDHGTGNIQR